MMPPRLAPSLSGSVPSALMSPVGSAAPTRRAAAVISDVARTEGGRIRPRLAALSLVMLLPSLGTSIANVALPAVAAAFGATMADAQWVVIVYLLAVTSLIVGMGRLGDVIGRRRLLLSGIALFAAASAAAALAPGLGLLVAARAVQGLGASAVGTALGPSLGGVLVAAFGWAAVFVALAGTGGLALVAGCILFPAPAAGPRRAARFDAAGMGLLAVALSAFSAAFILAGRMPVPAVAALGALAGLGFAAFVRHEARAPAPLVRLGLLRARPMAAALSSMALVSAILMATLVVGPFYLSGPLGLNAVGTGLVMSIGPTVAALVGVPAGRLVDRTGPFRVAIAGLVAVMAGAALLAVLPGLLGVGGYAGSLAVVTAGYALFQAANTTAVMQGATEDLRGVTSALLGLARNLGLITGAAAMGTLYAAAPRIAGAAGIAPSGETGLQATFAVAALLAALALGVSVRGRGQG